MRNKLKTGSKIWLFGEKKPYKVTSRNRRFIIVTKPMNIYHTYLYSIIDTKRLIAGPDSFIFGRGDDYEYNNQSDCIKILKELNNGITEISERRCVRIIAADKYVI